MATASLSPNIGSSIISIITCLNGLYNMKHQVEASYFVNFVYNPTFSDAALIARLLNQFAENAIKAANFTMMVDKGKRADGGAFSEHFWFQFMQFCRKARGSVFREKRASLAICVGVRCAPWLGYRDNLENVSFYLFKLVTSNFFSSNTITLVKTLDKLCKHVFQINDEARSETIQLGYYDYDFSKVYLSISASISACISASSKTKTRTKTTTKLSIRAICTPLGYTRTLCLPSTRKRAFQRLHKCQPSAIRTSLQLSSTAAVANMRF